MDAQAVLEQLKTLLVERLKFDPHRASGLTMDSTLPKGLEGSLGLDSLDFIEISLGIEDRFGVVIDEREDVAAHFESLGTLVGYITSRMGAA